MWQLNPDESSFEILCKTFEGLEEALAGELTELGYQPVEHRRAVSVTGGFNDVILLNFRLRTALNVMVKLAEFEIKKQDDLFNNAFILPWERFFETGHTFAISNNVRSTLFPHTQFAALRLKDAITDHFRKKLFKRPSVSKENPDVLIHLSIFENKTSLWFDTSGKPLYIRGYKKVNGPAPLNEVLAAGLIRLSGWDNKTPVINPMCGGGTLGFEAYMMARNLAPSFNRFRFAYHALPWFSQSLETECQKKVAEAGNLSTAPSIIFSDADELAIQAAKRNASSFGTHVDEFSFVKQDFFESPVCTTESILFINPPYGERMEVDDLKAFYRKMGDTFKHRYPGCTAWVITSALDEIKFLGLRPMRKIRVFNGPLEARWMGYRLYGFHEK